MQIKIWGKHHRANSLACLTMTRKDGKLVTVFVKKDYLLFMFLGFFWFHEENSFVKEKGKREGILYREYFECCSFRKWLWKIFE